MTTAVGAKVFKSLKGREEVWVDGWVDITAENENKRLLIVSTGFKDFD